MLLQLSHFFSPLYSPPPSIPLLPSFSHLSSCPWVIHVSSLVSPFPILFLPSSCLFYTYHLYFLFPVPFSPSSLHPSPHPSLLITLHVVLNCTPKFFSHYSSSRGSLLLPLPYCRLCSMKLAFILFYSEFPICILVLYL